MIIRTMGLWTSIKILLTRRRLEIGEHAALFLVWLYLLFISFLFIIPFMVLCRAYIDHYIILLQEMNAVKDWHTME